MSNDLAGRQFGRLFAIGFAGRNARRQALWSCQCECGAVVDVRASNLLTGNSVSCGCFRTESKRARKLTHGMSGDPTHTSWMGMNYRCGDMKDERYGGRGITVCERWSRFENFLADMGPRPDGLTLDRIDPDGNYTPENCRWADCKTQQRNRTNNRIFTYQGITAPLSALCERFGVSPKTAQSRLIAGAPIEIALTKGRLPRNTIQLKKEHS